MSWGEEDSRDGPHTGFRTFSRWSSVATPFLMVFGGLWALALFIGTVASWRTHTDDLINGLTEKLQTVAADAAYARSNADLMGAMKGQIATIQTAVDERAPIIQEVKKYLQESPAHREMRDKQVTDLQAGLAETEARVSKLEHAQAELAGSVQNGFQTLLSQFAAFRCEMNPRKCAPPKP